MADNTIAQAYVQIKPSMDGVTSDLEQAMGSAGNAGSKSFGASFANGLKGAGVVAAAATATVTAAAVKATKSFVSAASEVAVYGDNIDKMSQKMGISAEAYQEWDFVMQHCGTSMESLKASMKTMATAAESGNKAFDALGITQEEIANMSQEDLFAATITALQGVEDETTRTYLAGQTLGRGATELGALLNMSAGETANMREQIHELGGVLSDEAVASAAGFQDALQNMQVAASGLKNNLMTQFLPAITSVMDGLSAVFSGDSAGGLSMISEGINSVVSDLANNLPGLVELGVGIVQSLATAIMDNLPAIADAALQLVGALGQFMLDNLPTLIEVGMNVLLTIATGIIESLPVLIPAIVDVILTIVQKLTEPDTLVMLIGAALQLIIALTQGIFEALPVLIERAPEIIMNLVKALIKALPLLFEATTKLIFTLIEGITKMFDKIRETGQNIIKTIKDAIMEKVEQAKEWGKDLIGNLVQGIKDKISDVKKAIGDVAGAIAERIHFSQPDVGPLSHFNQWMPDMMTQMADQINAGRYKVQSAIGNVASDIAHPNTGSVLNYGGATINVYASDGMDVQELAERIQTILQNDVAAKGAVFA